MPADPAVQFHIDKAGQYQIQAALPGLSLDLQVVALYYAALHWLDALRKQRQISNGDTVVDAEDHTHRKNLMYDYGIRGEVNRKYLKLETLSRIARYYEKPGTTLEPGELVMAQRHYAFIVQHVRQNLAVYGYVFPP